MNAKRRSLSKDGQLSGLSGDAPKNLLLDAIRNKIQQGYYASKGVEDDLSEKLARLLDD